jgi:hypothetical protein
MIIKMFNRNRNNAEAIDNKNYKLEANNTSNEAKK